MSLYSRLCGLALTAFFAAAICRAQPVEETETPVSQTGLLAFWSHSVQHATTLGEVDWSKYTNITVEPTVNWPSSNNPFFIGGPTDYFALQLVGELTIPATGSWTLGLSSDAGARLFIDGALVVNDDANHSFRRRTATLTLAAGVHSIEVRYLEINYSQGLVLDWTGPGVPSVTAIPASALSHQPAGTTVTSAGHGLRAYWSQGTSHATRLGEVDWTQYDSTTVEPSVSWPITNNAFYGDGPTDYFSLRLRGTIDIPQSGNWQFKLGSDAGALLLIDGQPVIYDDANHSFRFRSGSVDLTAGEHDFEIRYLEINYSQGLVCTWRAPGAPYEEVIPTSAFRPAPVEPPGGAGGSGLNAFWTTGTSHAATLGQVDWSHYTTATAVPNVSWRITNNALYSGGPTDYFAVRIMGQITIPSPGEWTFKLGSDAGARLIIGGTTVVNDDANHSFRFRSGSVTLEAGVHDFEVRYLEINYSQGLVATWQAPGALYEEVIPAGAFAPAAFVPGAAGLGLRAYWSSGANHATRLGEVDWSTYDQVTTEAGVSWPITTSAFYAGGPTDYFACRLVGLINIPQAGSWTFRLGSDAGARLFVNGQLVVNDDANHSFRFTSGTADLPAGDVRIEIRYLEINYSQGLVLTWQGPGVPYEEVVPAGAFQPDPDEPPADPGGGGLRAYWSSGTSHATRLGEIDWLVYDTAGTVPKINWRITNTAFYTGGPTDYFAARFVAALEVPAEGLWTFKLGSDAGARLFIDGQLIVDDEANHSFRFRQGTAYLTEGPHTFEVRYMEVNYSQGLFVTWQAPGAPFEEVIPSAAFTPAPLESPGGPAAGTGGLTARWVTGNHSSLDVVNWDAVTHASKVDSVSWRITNNAFYLGGPTNYFGVRLTGTIDIAETGLWTFKLGSDAGARLLIDGVQVVNDDANHSFRFTPGTITLAAGKHQFEVQYIEINYSQGLVATWQGPGDAFESVIPPSAFIANKVRVVRWEEVGSGE